MLNEWIREANRPDAGAGRRLAPARDARRARPREPAGARRRRRPEDGARCWPSGASRPARGRDFAAADELRERIAALGWEVRDGAQRLRAAAAVILYGRNPVREALRGTRASSVRRGVGDEPARRASRGWRASPCRTAAAEEIERRCGSSAHQGVCAEVGRLPLRRRRRAARAGESPLIVALDQVQDPQNLGSICRTAECVGGGRRRDPRAPRRRGHAGRLQGLGGGRRAPAGRARAQPRRLPRATPARRAAGATAPAPSDGQGGRRPVAYDAPDYARRRRVLVLGSEGRGLRPRVAEACDELIALPLRGRVESLGVSAAAAARCCTRSCRARRA